MLTSLLTEAAKVAALTRLAELGVDIAAHTNKGLEAHTEVSVVSSNYLELDYPYRGEWSASTVYALNDTIQRNDTPWKSLAASNLNHTPPTLPTMSNAYWTLAIDGDIITTKYLQIKVLINNAEVTVKVPLST